MLIIPPQLLCLLCNKHDDICYSNTKIEPNALIKKTSETLFEQGNTNGKVLGDLFMPTVIACIHSADATLQNLRAGVLREFVDLL